MKLNANCLNLVLKAVIIIIVAHNIFKMLIATTFVKTLAVITLKPAPTMLAKMSLKQFVLLFVVISTRRNIHQLIKMFCIKKSSIYISIFKSIKQANFKTYK